MGVGFVHRYFREREKETPVHIHAHLPPSVFLGFWITGWCSTFQD